MWSGRDCTMSQAGFFFKFSEGSLVHLILGSYPTWVDIPVNHSTYSHPTCRRVPPKLRGSEAGGRWHETC